MHRWIVGKLPTFDNEHLLRVHSIQQASPTLIEGTGIREIATSLRDILSVGKQIEDIRLAGVRVKAAKIEVERKQIELENAKREEALQSELQQLNLEVEKAKKELELKKLKTQLNEEQLKQSRKINDVINDRFKTVAQNLKVIGKLLEELSRDVQAGIQLEVERLQETPFEFVEIKLE